jgi:hypothetical protein
VRRLLTSLVLVTALQAPTATRAEPESGPTASRFYGGAGIGLGAGVASVQGARLEFGRSRAAVAMALRGGLVVSPALQLGLHLDAVGASSGGVVPLGPCVPGWYCPATTANRVAVNHLSLVATWLPGGGDLLLRGGAGLAESFTERWDDPIAPVRRSFGPGLVGGLGWAPRVSRELRLSANQDGLRGWYGGAGRWAWMATVGVELR